MKEGTNFNDMSMEDLKTMINTNQNNISEENVEPNNEKKSEEPEKDNLNSENGNKIDTNESTKTKESEKTNPFSGKTADELLKIIQDQQKFISRQGTEIGELKKISYEKIAKEPEKKEEIDYKDYSKEDVQYVEKLIESKFHNLNKRQVEEQKAKRDKAYKENSEAYQSLQQETSIFQKVAPILNKRFEEDGKEAIYQEGWVQTELGKAIKQVLNETVTKENMKSTSNNTIKDSTIKNKAAATIQSNTTKLGNGIKDVTKMSAKEYLQYITEKMGIKDTRK